MLRKLLDLYTHYYYFFIQLIIKNILSYEKDENYKLFMLHNM